MSNFDLGLSHVALPVTDLGASIEFYRRFARLEVVHRRSGDDGAEVAWLSDLSRPFALVLIQRSAGAGQGRLGGWAHLGFGCVSNDDVDRRLSEAVDAGHSIIGPCDDGDPVGYWGIVIDPDGHNVEFSHGQRISSAVGGAATGWPPSS